MSRTGNNAFTLVELSIVLVILGLLTGGIITGTSMIRAAEIRSIMTNHSTYKTAFNTFRQKYYALPGDMVNATQFWEEFPSGCPTGGGGNGTCNGNGDKIIEWQLESIRSWQHMALAELLKGEFSGVLGVAPTTPSTEFSGGGYNLYHFGASATGYTSGAAPEYHRMRAGGASTTAEELFLLDTKHDDGKPAQGIFITSAPCATTLDTETAEYDLTFTDGCGFSIAID